MAEAADGKQLCRTLKNRYADRLDKVHGRSRQATIQGVNPLALPLCGNEMPENQELKPIRQQSLHNREKIDGSSDRIVRTVRLAMLERNVTSVFFQRAEADQMTRKSDILIVDDDTDVRAILVETLQDFGYGVECASNGEEALSMVKSRPHLRMLITDVRMPGMSGLELADHVRDQRSDMKIIIISGYFQPQRVRDRFLRKPFHLSELASAVEAELAG